MHYGYIMFIVGHPFSCREKFGKLVVNYSPTGLTVVMKSINCDIIYTNHTIDYFTHNNQDLIEYVLLDDIHMLIIVIQ